MAVSSSDAPPDLEEIRDAFGPPLGGASSNPSLVARFRTPAERWAYGAQFPLRTHKLRGPLWVHIRASVQGQPVGFGILNRDGDGFLSRVSIAASPRTVVTLHVPGTEEIGRLVVQTWENGGCSDVTVETITVLKRHSQAANYTLRPKTVSSMICRYEHWSTDWFQYWSERLLLPSSPTGGQIHRKFWEHCAIGQAFEERGMLRPGKIGLCFAAGREPLPSAFAALGCDILATDLASDQGKWGDQHARSRADLFYKGIVSREEFDERVKFRQVDMRNIRGIEPGKYDFLWSSCSFEHLGSLDAGLRFVTQAMKSLRPGGIAIHTTEFNLSSNDKTITSGDGVIYRRRDIEELDHRLRKLRYGLEPVDYDGGHHPFDLDYVSALPPPLLQRFGRELRGLLDEFVSVRGQQSEKLLRRLQQRWTGGADRLLHAPKKYTHDKPHIKLELHGYVSTSILLIIHKA